MKEYIDNSVPLGILINRKSRQVEIYRSSKEIEVLDSPATLKEALALDNQVNIDSLVETALREYIQRRKRLKVLDLFGTIEYDEGYNYKQQRHQA